MVETYYNKETGYYVTSEDQRPCSKIEKQGVDIHGHLIDFPWDNDGFSLCLDSYPSHLSKHSKLPSTASPLRRQWISQLEEDDEEEESIKETIKHNSLATNYIQKPKAKKENKTKIMGESFPYNNDEKFLDRMEQQQKKGRLHHISPLMNSSILEESDILFLSSTISSSQKRSNATSSIDTRKLYASERSQVSESGTLESWKVAKSPLTGMQSPVVIPLPQRSPTSLDDSSEFFTPPSSISSSTRTYHSVPVPKNADHLKYYSNSVDTKPKSRSYSQYFNPNFTRTKSKGPKSTGLFSKLLKNIKQHFTK